MNPEIQNGNIVHTLVCISSWISHFNRTSTYDTDYFSIGRKAITYGQWLLEIYKWQHPWYPSSMVGWTKTDLDVVEIDEDPQNVAFVEQSYSSNIICK